MDFTVFFASDIHGSEKCFLKFVNAGKFYGAQVLIMGGDLAGKSIVPIVRTNGRWESDFHGERVTLETEAEVEHFEKMVRFGGAYPFRTSQEEYDHLASNPAEQKALFLQLMRESISRWLAMADERLRGTGILCFVGVGNDDPWEIDEVLRDSACVRNPDGQIVDVFGHEMLSLGFSNPTPWNSPRELPEDQIAAKLEKLASRLRRPEQAIFNIHVPPHNTEIDHAPRLNPDLTLATRQGQPVMVPVGSTAVRAGIERFQPLLGLHGHIHESRGRYRLGRTTGFNPGSEYTEGILRGVLVSISSKKGVKSYTFTSG